MDRQTIEIVDYYYETVFYYTWYFMSNMNGGGSMGMDECTLVTI